MPVSAEAMVVLNPSMFNACFSFFFFSSLLAVSPVSHYTRATCWKQSRSVEVEAGKVASSGRDYTPRSSTAQHILSMSVYCMLQYFSYFCVADSGMRMIGTWCWRQRYCKIVAPLTPLTSLCLSRLNSLYLYQKYVSFFTLDFNCI